MMPEPPSPVHRAFLPGVVLIAAAVLAVLLFLLLWPVAALRDSLAALVQVRGDLIASALLVIALLLARGLIRIVFAFGRRLDAQADVAAIVRLENEHPVHVADVRRGRVQLIERSLAWHYQTEQVRAERSLFPQLSSLHQPIRIEGTAARLAEPAPALPEPFRASSHRPLLAQLHERGHVCSSGTSLLVGFDASGKPLYIELPECGFIGVGGQPRRQDHACDHAPGASRATRLAYRARRSTRPQGGWPHPTLSADQRALLPHNVFAHITDRVPKLNSELPGAITGGYGNSRHVAAQHDYLRVPSAICLATLRVGAPATPARPETAERARVG
jgi:hypothetical protein